MPSIPSVPGFCRQRRLDQAAGLSVPTQQKGLLGDGRAIVAAPADHTRRRRGAGPVGQGAIEFEALLPRGGAGLVGLQGQHVGRRCETAWADPRDRPPAAVKLAPPATPIGSGSGGSGCQSSH